jgi:hypothetical protein
MRRTCLSGTYLSIQTISTSPLIRRALDRGYEVPAEVLSEVEAVPLSDEAARYFESEVVGDGEMPGWLNGCVVAPWLRKGSMEEE